MRIKNVLILVVIAFILGSILSLSWAAYYWDRHIIGGGMDGTDGIPLKVAADGTLYIK